jgi:hypothetical protein
MHWKASPSKRFSRGRCSRGPFDCDRLLADALHLQNLIEEYGPFMVWHTGIDVLGYPPSWQIGVENALQIAAALEERSRQ